MPGFPLHPPQDNKELKRLGERLVSEQDPRGRLILAQLAMQQPDLFPDFTSDEAAAESELWANALHRRWVGPLLPYLFDVEYHRGYPAAFTLPGKYTLKALNYISSHVPTVKSLRLLGCTGFQLLTTLRHPYSENLHTIRINRCVPKGDPMSLILCNSEVSNLKGFGLCGSDIEDEQLKSFVSDLQTRPSFERLWMARNEISDDGLGEFFTNDFPELQTLYLSDNPITGRFGLIDGPSSDPSLRSLNLSNCNIRSETVHHIFEFVDKYGIREIDLSSNNLGEPWRADIIRNLDLAEIRTLRLANTGIGPSHIEILTDVLNRATLQEFDVRWNTMDVETLRHLSHWIRDHSHTVFKLRGNSGISKLLDGESTDQTLIRVWDVHLDCAPSNGSQKNDENSNPLARLSNVDLGHLREVEIENLTVERNHLSILQNALQSGTKLRNLFFRNVTINGDQLQDTFNEYEFPNLRDFRILDAKISPQHFAALSSSITCLRVLAIDGCELSRGPGDHPKDQKGLAVYDAFSAQDCKSNGKTLRRFLEFLHEPTPTRWYLNGTDLSDSCLDYILGIIDSTRLKQLELANCGISGEYLKCILHTCNGSGVERLNLTTNDDPDLYTLLRNLKLPSIEFFGLVQGGLTDREICGLTENENLDSLKRLSLKDQRLEFTAIQTLAESPTFSSDFQLELDVSKYQEDLAQEIREQYGERVDFS